MMEIKITGSPEDIAALVLAVQERQGSQGAYQCITMPRDEILLVSHGLKDGIERE